jgi:hypothetical protein
MQYLYCSLVEKHIIIIHKFTTLALIKLEVIKVIQFYISHSFHSGSKTA